MLHHREQGPCDTACEGIGHCQNEESKLCLDLVDTSAPTISQAGQQVMVMTKAAVMSAPQFSASAPTGELKRQLPALTHLRGCSSPGERFLACTQCQPVRR
jgi:hypothetical protein